MAQCVIGEKRKQPRLRVLVQVYGHQGYQQGMGGVIVIRLRDEVSQKQVNSLLHGLEAKAAQWLVTEEGG